MKLPSLVVALTQVVVLTNALAVTYFSETDYKGQSLQAVAENNNCTEIPADFGPARSIKLGAQALCFLASEAACEGDSPVFATGDVAKIEPPAVSIWCMEMGASFQTMLKGMMKSTNKYHLRHYPRMPRQMPKPVEKR
ncbi:hypothetical protein FQN57_003517 [Myotisia sp. PD_48]|nr:hypothetical protein FQN57_003517 [Myotisia sp. PD_48]